MNRWTTVALCVATACVVGGGVFVARGGLDRVVIASADDSVVEVALVDSFAWFDVTPDVIEVERGSSLTIDVINRAEGVHDLEIAGIRTRPLEPGERERLRFGRVDTTTTGRCTIGEHDSTGMTVEIRVTG